MSPKIAILLAVALSFAPSTFAAPPVGAPQKSVLLLRNGEVLCGEIAKVGDRYVATLGNGSELRISVREVEMHCVDLNEVYLRKRASVTTGSLDDHLSLADWCLCNSLHGPAAEELLRAIAISPRHPKINWFERRLQMAITQPASSSDRPAEESHVVSLNDLERTMQGLPENTVETFVSRVQPLLLNRCGASTCHGSRAESEFRLVRSGWGKTVTRRITQRNLHATLRTVDQNAPQESPLLSAPSAPHGNLAGAVFTEREEEQLRVLVDWVKQVTRDQPRRALAVAPEPAGELMQASYEEPVHLPQTPSEVTPPAMQIASPMALQPPATSSLVPPAPRDAFDPEVFNRRHHSVVQPGGNPD